MFASLDMPELEVFPSRPLHHRMRCELRVWHEGDTMDYVMFSLNSTDDFLADPGARSDGGEDSGDDRGSGEGDVALAVRLTRPHWLALEIRRLTSLT